MSDNIILSSFSIQDLKAFAEQVWGVKKKQHCAALSKLEKHGFGFLQVFKDPTHVIIHYKETGLERETCMRSLGYIRIIMEALIKCPENVEILENINIDFKALDQLKQLVDNVYQNEETDSISDNDNIENNNAVNLDKEKDKETDKEEESQVTDAEDPTLLLNLFERHQEAMDELNTKVEFLKKIVDVLVIHASDDAKKELLKLLMVEKFERV